MSDDRRIVRLEVSQRDPDYALPTGTVLRSVDSGEAMQLVRRRRRECDERGVGEQTWWVSRRLDNPWSGN